MSEQNRQMKVLRIGIIQDGKVQEERLVEMGEDVTVGKSKGATFVVPDAKMDAPQMTLFAFRDGRYQLQFDNVIKGKISVDGKPTSLDKARRGEIPVGKAGELFALPLKDSDKGKLRVGSTTVLFQFVPPPPVAAASDARVSFRPRWFDDDDPVFLGFLALWSALGIVFMVWVQNTEVPERTIDEIPDRFVNLKPPPPVETPPEEPEPKVEEVATGKVEKVGGGPAKDTPKASDKPAPEKGSADEAQAVKDAEQQLVEENALFAAAQAQMLGTVGENARGTVLSDNAQGNYSDIDAKLKAAAEAGAQLGNGSVTKGGVIGGTGARGQEGGVKAGKTGDVEVAGGPTVAAPKPSLTTDGFGFDGEGKANVLNIVRRYQGQLNYCYERALKSDPTTRGRVVVEWFVEGGKAIDVEVVQNGTGSREFADCIVLKIKNWRFSGVDDGFAQNTFIFQPQE